METAHAKERFVILKQHRANHLQKVAGPHPRYLTISILIAMTLVTGLAFLLGLLFSLLSAGL